MPTAATARDLAAARAAVRTACARHDATEERCDDVLLVLSELVGNAFRHGDPPVIYDVAPDAGDLLVTVEDHDPTPPPAVLPDPAATAESGRGLRIVAELARRWGWRPTNAGKVVWARL